MYLSWYSSIGTQLKMAGESAPRKVELVFFRGDAGGEPVPIS
jgi:hypothetical protein